MSRLLPAERPVCVWIVEPEINLMRWAEYQIFHATVSCHGVYQEARFGVKVATWKL